MLPRLCLIARRKRTRVDFSIGGTPVNTLSQQSCWLSSGEPPRGKASHDTTSQVDLFQVFHLPHSFDIDTKKLKTSYRQLMGQYHPDRTTATAQHDDDNDDAQQFASTITHAYQVLLHPHLRATHLLEILQRPLNEEMTGALVGSDFLMAIMQTRESIEDSESDAQLQPILEQNSHSIQQVCRELNKAFEQNDLDEAVILTAKLQYFNRIEETIRERMEPVE